MYSIDDYLDDMLDFDEPSAAELREDAAEQARWEAEQRSRLQRNEQGFTLRSDLDAFTVVGALVYDADDDSLHPF
jgi:hypothetical protein